MRIKGYHNSANKAQHITITSFKRIFPWYCGEIVHIKLLLTNGIRYSTTCITNSGLNRKFEWQINETVEIRLHFSFRFISFIWCVSRGLFPPIVLFYFSLYHKRIVCMSMFLLHLVWIRLSTHMKRSQRMRWNRVRMRVKINKRVKGENCIQPTEIKYKNPCTIQLQWIFSYSFCLIHCNCLCNQRNAGVFFFPLILGWNAYHAYMHSFVCRLDENHYFESIYAEYLNMRKKKHKHKNVYSPNCKWNKFECHFQVDLYNQEK